MSPIKGQSLFNVYDVFTPTTQARLNYVPRASIDSAISQALLTPGKQVIVYGETGSGKSTLLLNKLEQIYSSHITTRCSSTTSFETLLLDGFDQLDRYYTDTSGKASARSASLTADFLRIRAQLGKSSATTSSGKRIVPPQLTAQRLGEFMGEVELCWVIEDFHKPADTEKIQMNQTLKIFSDLASVYKFVKIVAIGATETAREVVAYEPEMANRVAEILVPLMKDEELRALLQQGQEMMNVDLSDLIDSFVQYATGIASVCHQLGLNACLERDIVTTSKKTVTFANSDLRPIVEAYLNECSDTLKSTFDLALFRERKRKYDNCRLILAAIASGPLVGMHQNEILARIRQSHSDYPSGNLTNYLAELMSEKRGSILRHSSEDRFRFIDPLHHVYAQIALIEQSQGKTKMKEKIVNEWTTNFLIEFLQTGKSKPLSSKHLLEPQSRLIWKIPDFSTDKLDEDSQG